MRLRKVTAINTQGQTLELPVEDSSGGFLVKSIDGLGPVKGILASSSYAGLDGARFQGGKRDVRNIVIRLDLVPDDWGLKNPGTLRNELAAFFTPPQKTKLQLEVVDPYNPNTFTRVKTLEIDTIVETNEPTLWTSTPGVTISLMAFDEVAFCEVGEVTTSGLSTEGLDETAVEYEGDIETGVEFVLEPAYEFQLIEEGFTVYHRTPSNELHSFVVTPDFLAIQRWEFSTVPGNIYARQVGGTGVVSSQLWGVTTQSDWFKLEKGTNHIRVALTLNGAEPPVPWTMKWRNKYGGI